MLYNNITSLVKKNTPKLYTLLKDIKHRYIYNQRYFNQLLSSNLNLIDHILKKKNTKIGQKIITLKTKKLLTMWLL